VLEHAAISATLPAAPTRCSAYSQPVYLPPSPSPFTFTFPASLGRVTDMA